MLRCSRILRLLADFIGQELPTEYHELVEDHLRICQPCSALAISYQNVIDLGRRLPELPLPDELLNHLRVLASQHGIEFPASPALPPRGSLD